MRTRTVLPKRERTRTAAPDLMQDYLTVESATKAPRFFVYGGFLYEIVAETGQLITGIDRSPDKVINGGKTTVGSKLVHVFSKDNVLVKYYHILLERRKLLKDEVALRENLFAIKGVEKVVKDLHYANL